jgi:hypothetical protein
MLKIYSNFISQDEIKKLLNTPELINKPISIFNDYPNATVEQLSFNPYNILMVLEPNQLFGIHDWAVQNYQSFSCILTWGQTILDNCPNALFFPMGVSWLDKEYVDNINNIQKRFEVSFLCGGKQIIEGHYLRHRLYKRENEILIPKQWYYTLPDYQYNGGNHTIIQYEGQPPGSEKKRLWESMFTIAVENSSNRGYHTEKIIDTFLSKTFPIYWGCPNLEELGYDPNGFIYCKDENEIINAVNQLTSEFYNERKAAIDYNYELAKYYADLFGRLKSIVEEIVEYNQIEDKVLSYDQLFKKYKGNHKLFFETGTHKGDGVQNALNMGFEEVISIEILPELYEQCVKRFDDKIKDNKVHLFLGDSNEYMEEMLELIKEPSLIFLDGHFNNGDPLWKELEILKNHPIKTHTIIVDDMPNYFGNGEKVKEKLLEINPNYTLVYEDSLNPGTGKIHKNHNLTAYIKQ